MKEREKYSDLPVIAQWECFVRILFGITKGFPKRVKFTFANRLDTIALEILEALIEARYSHLSKKERLLKEVNIHLEKLRILIRISKEERYLSLKAYEKLAREMDEIGKQVGGWLKVLSNKAS